jgi:hypothetical protein
MELRLYSFCNFYISPIQQGIQTGHAAVDLVRKYTNVGAMRSLSKADMMKTGMVSEWADNHKTFIVLNGGDNDGICEATTIIKYSDLPFCSFIEPGLGDIQTCVVVVVPESIFNARLLPVGSQLGSEDVYGTAVAREDGNGYREFTYREGDKNFELVKLLRSSGLAR